MVTKGSSVSTIPKPLKTSNPREFTNGWSVYNRSGREQRIQLPEKVSGVASGVENKHWHTIGDLDGEIYLKITEIRNRADLNGDGTVNVLDLVIIANAF